MGLLRSTTLLQLKILSTPRGVGACLLARPLNTSVARCTTVNTAWTERAARREASRGGLATHCILLFFTLRTEAAWPINNQFLGNEPLDVCHQRKHALAISTSLCPSSSWAALSEGSRYRGIEQPSVSIDNASSDLTTYIASEKRPQRWFPTDAGTFIGYDLTFKACFILNSTQCKSPYLQ